MSISRLSPLMSISGVFYTPLRFEEIPVPDVGVTSLILNGDELIALVGVKGKGIYFRMDGGVPSANAGHYFGVGSFMTLGVPSIKGLRVVGNVAEEGVARISISYEK